MENKPNLIETLSWIKEKLEDYGNCNTIFHNLFNHTEGLIERSVLAFNFDKEGNIILSTRVFFSNWTEDRNIEKKNEFHFNIKSLNHLTITRLKNDNIIKRDSPMHTIELISYNMENKFECIDLMDKSGTSMIDCISIPLTDDDKIIQRIKKAFEYIIANFGDNRQLPLSTEPF
ncbi:MAG: hypothetical protein WC833_11040 [Bacteroidales bacterium]|jgi:hypothetical protein